MFSSFSEHHIRPEDKERDCIEELKTRCLFGVAALEELAWESGKPDARVRIDCKIDLESYKRFAAASGLRLEAEFCVTLPEMASSVGGMYVLVFQKPAAR